MNKENKNGKYRKNVRRNIEKMLEEIEKMTVIELADLVKAIEEKFGVSAAAVAAPAAAGEAAGAAEKSEFDVELTSVGGAKIEVMKVVKTVSGLGLKEAKELVDGAPKVVKSGVSKDEAEEIKKQLEAAGATVTLK